MQIYMKNALVLSLALTLSLQTLAIPAPFVKLPRARSHYLHARQETVTIAPTFTAPSPSETTTDSATPTVSPSIATTDSAMSTAPSPSSTTTDSATLTVPPSTTTTDSATPTVSLSTVTTEPLPITSPPTSVPPTSPAATEVPLTSVSPPVSVPPTSVSPTSVSPTSVAPTSVPPPTEVPTNSPVVQPTPPPLSPPPVIPPATTVTINPKPTPIPTLPTIASTATPTISGTQTSTATGSVKGTISGTRPLVPTTTIVPVTTATTAPTVPVTPTLSTSNKTWIIFGGSAAGVLVLALACIFCTRRHRKKQRNRKRLLASNDGLSSQTNIMGSNGGNDNDGENGDGDDDDSDLDSEKAFFMVNPVRVRSPQMTHSENHDLGVKTPLDQYEAQKYKWQDPIDISNRHPQDHIRQQHLKRLLELQQEQLIKLNALVERYRVIYSRPQSPHSPVMTETRLSTRLSFFPDDDDDEVEEEDLASEEIRKLELKGDERLYHVPPVEEGPFRDQGEIEDEDVELQLLEVNHHYQGPFQDTEDNAPMHSVGNIFDDVNLQEDPKAIADADFEVASIITRGSSINLLSDSLDLPSEYLDKGKAIASSIRDSNSFLGLPLSTRVSSDSLREAFGLRGSSSTLAGSSTGGARCSGSTMGESSEYSGGVESSNSQGRQGGERSGRRGGRGSPLSGPGTEEVTESVKVWLPKIQTGTEMDQLERQREREQSEILMKAIAQVKAQYADQYRQIHEDLANLELEMEE